MGTAGMDQASQGKVIWRVSVNSFLTCRVYQTVSFSSKIRYEVPTQNTTSVRHDNTFPFQLRLAVAVRDQI